MIYEKQIAVRWSDCDPNRHVRHSAYYDYGAHIRIRFFDDFGFSVQKLEDLGIGPIIFKEECSFIRELKANDTITINILKGELREDISRWVLHHEIFNQEGVKCAQVSLLGAWIDLDKRKLTIGPEKLAEAFHQLEQGDYYSYKKSKK